jgi:hypothetical protein
MVKEVTMPQLATYEIKPYFYIEPNTKGAVVFSAPVGGATTSNSQNPRSELRQMKTNGDEAAWSNKSQTWNMEAIMAFHELPSSSDDERGVVGMQVHDGKDDVTVLRLELTGDLWLTNGNESHQINANSNYVLDTFMKVRITAKKGGGFQWFINDQFKGQPVSGVKSGCYFKAGAYTQCTPSQGSGRGTTLFRSLKIWATN